MGRGIWALAAAAVIWPAAAQAASAPDAGRAFQSTPVSEPVYAVKNPSEDPARQRTYVEGADGVDIFIETWLPKASGDRVPPDRVPVIVTISPYLRQGAAALDILATVVPRGYAYANVHVRGTGESGGCIEDHNAKETEDGLRALDYLARQAPWSNGVLGGYGLSYPGGSLFAVAASGDPRAAPLKAAIIGAPVASRYDTLMFDGVPQLVEGPVGFAAYLAIARPGATTGLGHLSERPRCFGPQVRQSYVDDTGGDFTDYYAEREHRDGSHRVTAATLMFHGLQDLDVQSTMQAGMFERIAAPKHGYFGVFGHERPSDHTLTNLRREWERLDWGDTMAAWFDRWVKGLPSGADAWPVVEIQGSDGQWRAEREWPLTGGASGQLALGPGGALGTTAPSGSTDYVELELESGRVERSDASAARFQTAPLPERLEITGQPVIDAWVTLDRPDAHLAAAFEALDAQDNPIPGSRVYGARSARHLDPLVDNRFAQAEGKNPPVGVPIRVPIRLQPADVVVPAGGRLRLVLAGSVRTGVGLNELAKYFGTGDAVDLDPAGIAQPTQPSGSATRVTLHHNCEHPTVLRFLLPDTSDYLNVREKDEPFGEPLASNPYEPPSTDGGGLATAPVCGAAAEHP